MISIAISAENDIYRNGLKLLVAGEPDLRVIFEANSIQGIQRKIKTNPIDVLLIITEQTNHTLTNSIVNLKTYSSNMSVIVFGNKYSSSSVLSLFQSGINSYLLRNSNKKVVMKAIRKLSVDNYYFQRGTPVGIKSSVMKKEFKNTEIFNSREIEVMQLICEDCSTQEIANKIRLSSRTVEWYKRAILQKTGTKSSIEILKYANQKKLFDTH